ncbi:peptidyl-prolyl cis-trans isomerase [Ralstonia pseudosolanacearum]|uniref:peptidylprolyl isomerase n=1 Tax=Ralstonia pseudosolanacearum TaxID=1310165 RepID=UPI001E52B208|nr:peptidyl-prolyl cis-trans isomerase [Ralstonia pseudosolanacearum]UWD92016.1 peptidyl-prolyl cis-trans isomerase [Ralstonia pseudosolanacearum]CAH0445584.1 putative parvulin-type peptidyl-prolyl cis-trans isomerase [Ralstonia pseudosolanacearum]
MNRPTQFLKISIAVLSAVAAMAAPSAHADGLPPGVIALVNGAQITQAQLDRAIAQSGAQANPQVAQALKQQLIARELFRQQAAKNSAYDKLPAVKQAMQEAHDAVITQAWLKDNIKPAPITEEQVRARYDAIVASLGDKEYKARVIQLGDDVTAAQVLAQLKQGGDFAKLAQQYSTAPNKVRGGDMDWVSFKVPVEEGKTQNLPLPLAREIATLAVGAASTAPVEAGSQRYLVKVEAARPTQVPGYEAVRQAIRQALETAELERVTVQVVGGLLKAAKIVQ